MLIAIPYNYSDTFCGGHNYHNTLSDVTTNNVCIIYSVYMYIISYILYACTLGQCVCLPHLICVHFGAVCMFAASYMRALWGSLYVCRISYACTLGQL